MSLWADYHKETEGHETIENEFGFIRYSFNPPLCVIHDIYVSPKFRQKNCGRELFSRVRAIAKENKMTHLWSRVWLGSLTADLALKANIAGGFKVHQAENNSIIMMQEVG